MKLRFKTITLSFLLGILSLALAPMGLLADPLGQVTSDEAIYQKVKKLGDYGLLDPRDKEVLDQDKVVTRLELAFYTEKAKIKIIAPELAKPTPVISAPPASQPAAFPPPMDTAPGLPEAPPMLPVVAPPTAMPPVTAYPSAAKQEIENILKELEQESSYLRNRLTINDDRIRKQEVELEKLKTTQAEVDKIWKKANKTSGSPNFSTHANFIFEHLNISGISDQTATKAYTQFNLGMWSDLGGKGEVSLGLSAFVPFDNASAGPASISAYSPKIKVVFEGPLGRWETNAMVEGYVGDTTLGDFTRGVAPSALRRFEKPFEVKNFDDPPNKNTKLWDDYMNSIGFVASASYGSGAAQSTSDRVFDGVFGIGTHLPLFNSDGKMTLLIGRMGTSASDTQKWEKAVKYQQPWLEGKLKTAFAMMMVDEYKANVPPETHMRDYALDIGINVKPFNIVLQGALSTLYTGIDTSNPLNPQEVWAPAGQITLSYYPFSIYGFGINENYANFQSKVMLGGVPWTRYGLSFATNHALDMYGAIGEVDSFQSNRWGWRANLGWNGRKQDWMKDWPSFLDTFTVNLDVAQKNEFRVAYYDYAPGTTPNYIEAFNLVTFYYPDDEGLWGKQMWGGYSSPANPVRQAFIDNTNRDPFRYIRYQFQLSSEWFDIFDVASNQWLPHVKSYHYITLTTKWQLSRLLNIKQPFNASLFFTNNTVSGQADPSAPLPPGVPAFIPDLFTQRALDLSLMYQIIKNVNLLGNYQLETWNCNYTWPLVDYNTNSFGAGLAYDIPWGAGKFEFRYKHISFNNRYVPANSFEGDQIYSALMLAF